MDLIIMRHGERDIKGDVPERDQCLTPNGKNKAKKTGASICKVLDSAPAIVMSSPFRPAMETAQIVCEQLGIKTLGFDNDLAPDKKLSDVIKLLQSPLQERTVIIVGHNPQLEDLVKQLSSKKVTIERGDCCRLEVNSLYKQDATVCEMPPGDPRDAPKRPSYWKTIGGMVFAGLAFITLLVGGLVLFMGIKAILAGAGEEGITAIVVKGYGEVKDVISGVAMILTPIGYVRKAYQEAAKDESKGFIYTIRHMWPF